MTRDTEYNELLASHERLLEVVKTVLPTLDDNARFLRDTQADPALINRAFNHRDKTRQAIKEAYHAKGEAG